MALRITQVDAFTDTPFAGNPAAVCVLPEAAPDRWMQDVAREMNLSETAFLLPAARPAVTGAGGEARLADVLRRTDVIALLAACGCMSAAHGALYGFFSLHAEALGYSKTAIGALWTLGVLAEIGVFLAWPQLARRYSLRVLLIASFLCAAVRFAAIGWGTHVLVLLVAAQLLHAATFGVFHAASVAAVHRLFTGRLQARGQTLYSSLSYGLGGGAGLLIAGWTWETLGAGASFTVSSAFALLGAALVTWRVRVWPDEELVQQRSPLGQAVLVGGLTLALLLSAPANA